MKTNPNFLRLSACIGGFFCLFIHVPSFADDAEPVAALPVHAWWSRASMAMKALERAPEFGVNAMILENDLEDVGWGEVTGGLCNYDFSDRCRRDAAGRAKVEKLRARYRRISAEARRQGVDCYVMCPEVHAPQSFGPLSYDDPALWALIRDRLREMFQTVPDLAGYVLYLTEGPMLDVEDLPGSEPSKTRRARRLIDACWEGCKAEKRKMMVTTFIHNPKMLEATAEALRSLPPDPGFAVLQYCCPNDWGLYELVNPSIGRVGPHPEILGFDSCGENWGQGAYPFVQSAFMSQRLREARARSKNIAGLASYVAWTDHTALGNFNEANLYTCQALTRNPTRDGREILREWCAKRFGEGAADLAAEILGRTQPAVFKMKHIFGYWVDTTAKGGLPLLQEMDDYLIRDVFGEALTKWDPDPELKKTWDGILHPDEAFLRKVLAEKDEAIQIFYNSGQEVEAAFNQFKREDYRALKRALGLQLQWAHVWRGHIYIFFLRQMGKAQGWPAEIKTRLSEELDRYSAEADRLDAIMKEDRFPAGPERAKQFVREVMKEIPPGSK